jgi:hypothetical protein
MDPLGRPAVLAAALRRLGHRLDAIGYPMADLELASGSCALLVDRGGARRGAILHAGLAALPGTALEATVEALRRLAPSRPLSLLAYGTMPEPSARRRLRQAGIDLALYEPLDAAVLHFQVNRALAPGETPKRLAPRAPLEAEVAVCRWLGARPVRVYSMSSRGAFLLTDEPLRAGRRLVVELPAGRLRPRARARVVLANPADRPTHAELPPGMAVAFQDLDAASAAVLERLVLERLAALAV